MAEYNFSTLSPVDFELLVSDLLRAEHGWNLESFGHGPDGGVDLRADENQQKIVVQCKHYRGSTYRDLKRAASGERVKMDDERPNRYLFVTSQDLSRRQKDELIKILSPWVKQSTDVLCLTDLNSLLDLHPLVEQRHFKLWLASVGVIERIVQCGVWERSEALMEEIQDRVKLNVSTDSYQRACKMLLDKHIVIITGAPGVGKSMLADMLALTYWEDDWQIVSLPSHRVDQCWEIYRRDRKQLFYFDDVFGQTDVNERLSRDSGLVISKLMRRISTNPNKRLVITTRTHILRQAEQHDEPTAQSNLSTRECVVQISDYGLRHKARIVYNHLYFSEQPRSTIHKFVEQGYYWKVIKHPNFTPRIIEQILMKQHHGNADDLAARLAQTLDHPIMLWGPSFAEALSRPAQQVLMQLISFPVRGAPIEILRQAARHDSTPMEYTKGIRQLEGSWIRLESKASVNSGTTLVSFHDPSCRDFVLAFIDSEPDCATDILNRATDVSQVALLLAYCCATDSESRPTYIKLRAWALAERQQISRVIKECPLPNDPELARHFSDTLMSLREANKLFMLDLRSWIDNQTLRMGCEPYNRSLQTTRSIETLMCDLIHHGRSPMNLQEKESFLDAFEGWLHSISEESEWHAAGRFLGACAATPGFSNLHPELLADFRRLLKSWIEDEFRVVEDNANDYGDATQWIGSLEELANSHLKIEAMKDTFEAEYQHIYSKYHEYEPTYEDLRRLEDFATSVQEPPVSPSLSSTSRRDRTERSDELIIRQWFEQLK